MKDTIAHKYSSRPSAIQRAGHAASSEMLDRQSRLAQAAPRAASHAKLQILANNSPAVQRLATLQRQMNAGQRAGPLSIQRVEEEDLMQGKMIQWVEAAGSSASGGQPAPLRSGIESLSGMSIEGVQVHRNSGAPAQVGAHAYAQRRDIHLGPGQERHMPHEAWHVAQQAQGRVKPTMQAKGVAINDDTGLEREADVMGAKAMSLPTSKLAD